MSAASGAGWRRGQLAYCSNVHAGETLADVSGATVRAIAAVRERRGLPRIGSGLWLSSRAVAVLAADSKASTEFARVLDDHGIELFTLNGFPFGDFHAPVVKERVYLPDWTQAARLDYTLQLARVLATVLPAGGEGSISTLPLGYAQGWTPARMRRAEDSLCHLAQALHELRQDTGRTIRVCIEMEPGCVLERTPQLIDFFRHALPRAAERVAVDVDLLQQYLGVCFDVCHQSVMFEDPYRALSDIRAAGIRIGKIQISSALVVPSPGDPVSRERLGAYAEPRYLHQVRYRDAAGVGGWSDLPAALEAATPTASPWRIHFHVPVQAHTLADGFETTRDGIARTLDFLQCHPGVRPHLEVETYTWQVLPAAQRPTGDDDLSAGIARELEWLEAAMSRQGLLDEAA